MRRRRTPDVPFFFPDWFLVREIAANVREFLARFAHGRVLDIGCGEKPFFAYAPGGVSVWTGLDLPGNPAADVHATADALPFPDASFETVLCTEVLEHLPDASAGIREIGRVLADGGHAIVTVPFLYPLHEEPHDYRRFTPYGLRAIFEGASFDVVEERRMATGLRAAAVIANVCIFNCAERLPGGASKIGRAVFLPVYTLVNVCAAVLGTFVDDPRASAGSAIVARKRPRALAKDET